MPRKNKLILAVTLIAGIAFVVVMVKLKQPPERTAEQVAATPARILEVMPLTVRTEARGYGQVLPARSWMAVANVGGRITSKHPDLESGKLTRVTGSLDPATRTIQAVITVEEPYRNANPPARPPLVRNMFVQATIVAPTPEPVLVVPASSIHQGEVYLVDGDDRLQRQPVSLAWQQGELAVVRDGLKPGDRLILDDLVPAIEGTRLSPPTRLFNCTMAAENGRRKSASPWNTWAPPQRMWKRPSASAWVKHCSGWTT